MRRVNLAADGCWEQSEEHLEMPSERTLKYTTWKPLGWNDAARKQIAHHHPSGAPLATSNWTSWHRAVLAQWAWEEWDEELGKTECVFPVYDKIRWKYDDAFQLCGLLNTYSPSLWPPLLPLYLHRPAVAPWTCTWRAWLEMFVYALGDRDRVNSELHLVAVIERVGRYTGRPRAIKIGGVLGGSRLGVRRVWGWDCIYWLTYSWGNVESWVQQDPPRDEKLTGSEIQSIMWWCSSWCILYSVLTHDHGVERERGMT